MRGEKMRTVIVCNIASVDGYYADPTNPLALNMDEAFDAYNLERIAAADVVLLGRESFLGFSSYWPHVADAPDDPGNRAVDDTNREISRIYNRVPKVVVSDSLTVPEDNPWHQTTTVVSRDDAAAEVARLKRGGEGDVLIFASHILWNALLRQGLVDEVHIVVSLIDAEAFPASDNALLRYSAVS
jgi:dihydrofolate reductase